MSDNKVNVELTESQAQQVLRTVEKDPDSGNWGDGNKTRNEVTEAFRSALSAGVVSASEETEAKQEPAEVEDDVAADEQPNTDESADDSENDGVAGGVDGADEVPAEDDEPEVHPVPEADDSSDESDRS